MRIPFPGRRRSPEQRASLKQARRELRAARNDSAMAREQMARSPERPPPGAGKAEIQRETQARTAVRSARSARART